MISAAPSAPAPTTRLATSGVTLAYGDVRVVEDLSFSVPDRQVTAIVGANACGKSTLLRALARLLRPAAGSVLLDGGAISELPTREVARRLALLPQSPIAPAGILVGDLVARGRSPHQRLFRSWSAADEEAVRAALEATGTADLADRCVEELSGGQRQRVWIAMALAQDTDLLLLDEPTTFLDVSHQVDVLDLVDRLNREQGRTVVVVLHDLNLAARYASHLVAMHGGEVVAAGPPEQVVTARTVRDGVRPGVRGRARPGVRLPPRRAGGWARGRAARCPRQDRHSPSPDLRPPRPRARAPMHGIVTTTTWTTPTLVSVELGGPGLDGFEMPESTDAYVNVAIPPPGAAYGPVFDPREVHDTQPREAWPARRRYTVRRWDRATRRLTLEFVVHGAAGAAGPWAAAAREGDVLVFNGPGSGYRPDPDAGWHLMVGDESALPAIAASLEALQVSAPAASAVVRLVCDGPGHQVPLEGPEGLDLRWLHRSEADPEPLLAAVEALAWREGSVDVFVHGEAQEVRDVRRHLVVERGLAPGAMSCSPYWRRGMTDEGWRSVKKDFTAAMDADVA